LSLQQTADSRDGKLIASSTSEAAAARGATPGGGNAFTLFVKTHFADVKRGLPTGTPHKEVMTRLAASYKEQKLVAATAAAAATATTPGPGALPQAGRGLTVTGVVTAISTETTYTLTTTVTRPGAAGAAAAGAAAAGKAGVTAAAAGTGARASRGDDEAVESDDEGWQTAEEEIEEQTSSLLSFMDRLALS
jgi:hypothetical protein